MQMSMSFMLLLVVLVGMLALVSVFISFRLRPTKQSYIALTVAILPALLMLALCVDYHVMCECGLTIQS